MVLKFFTNVHYLVFIAAVSSLIGSALMFFIGVVKTISAYVYYFYGHAFLSEDYLPEYLTPGDLATVSLAQAIDVFLFALVMMILAMASGISFSSKKRIRNDSIFPNGCR